MHLDGSGFSRTDSSGIGAISGVLDLAAALRPAGDTDLLPFETREYLLAVLELAGLGSPLDFDFLLLLTDLDREACGDPDLERVLKEAPLPLELGLDILYLL